MKRYIIKLVESTRGWGQDYWYEYYDSYKEAIERIKNVNSQNTSITPPDHYIQADERIEVVGE